MVNIANDSFFPRTGSCPRKLSGTPRTMGTSVFVELGNDKNLIFDMGPDSVANYLASGVPLNQINDIFLTHLHWYHVASVPYVLVFGGWAGRWYETVSHCLFFEDSFGCLKPE